MQWNKLKLKLKYTLASCNSLIWALIEVDTRDKSNVIEHILDFDV